MRIGDGRGLALSTDAAWALAAYVYGCIRTLSDLYLVEGLR